ncbi:MAG: hypothetical protein WC755_04505 [Candidatus Woesearchaeota archaeon]|jgi:hypothetical protein
MVKLQFNKKQYTITVSSDLVKRMGWSAGAELFVSKDPHSDMLYIEEITSLKSSSNLTSSSNKSNIQKGSKE